MEVSGSGGVQEGVLSGPKLVLDDVDGLFADCGDALPEGAMVIGSGNKEEKC